MNNLGFIKNKPDFFDSNKEIPNSSNRDTRWKVFKYDVSLTWSVFLNKIKGILDFKGLNSHLPKSLKIRDWFNEIKAGDISFNIILGGIPLKNLNHIEKINKISDNNFSILSMVEKFEINRDLFFSKPVKDQYCKRFNIERKVIETPDFLPVETKKLKEGVEFIKNKIKENKKVYIHCKAGRGRSGAVAVAYVAEKLMEKKAFLSPEDAYNNAHDIVKRCRPILSVGGKKVQIMEYLQGLKTTK